MAAQPTAAASANEAQVADLQAEQARILEQLREQLKALPANDPSRRSKTEQLAAIEKRMMERTLYVTARTTDESALAYQKDIRGRIERTGASNFPVVDGHKLYGDLWLILRITQDGKLQSARVVRSSGNAALDQKAAALAQKSEPFPPFDASLREKWDAIVLVAGFHFKHDLASQPSH